jgi:hypothetical protein
VKPVDNTNQSGSREPADVLREALKTPGKTKFHIAFEAGIPREAITERLDALRKLVESVGGTMTVESVDFPEDEWDDESAALEERPWEESP